MTKRSSNKHGPAWIVIEESPRSGSRTLVSILAPRRTVRDVAAFVEQLYVDRTASIQGRLQYKKSRKAIYEALVDGHVMHCGHDPFLVAIYAQQTTLKDDQLEFRYRIITKRGPTPMDIATEERVQSIEIPE
jgi:hypothetical protein